MEFRVAAKIQGRHKWTTPQRPHPNHFARFENGTDVRFEQFVADFVGGAASSSHVFPSIPEHNIYHVFSMTGVLWWMKRQRDTLAAEGLMAPSLHYLPTINDLDNEFPKFLSRTCHGLPLEATKRWNLKLGDHESRLDYYGFYSSAKRVWAKQLATSRALCAIHALDYACFDLVPVPMLCLSLFVSDRFHDRVMQAATITK